MTLHNIVCERHFRQEDMIYLESFVNGSKKIVKSLRHSALPIPINGMQSESNASYIVPGM